MKNIGVILGGILVIVFGILIGTSFWGWGIISIGLIILGIGGMFGAIIENNQNEKQEAKNESINRETEIYIEENIHNYGKPEKIIIYSENGIHNYICIFESCKKILIKNKLYNFSDFISYNLSANDNIISSYSIKTSTSSALGRGIIGGALAGGVGAIIGASTAEKKVEKNTDVDITYILILTLDNLSEPNITLKFPKNIIFYPPNSKYSKEYNSYNSIDVPGIFLPLEIKTGVQEIASIIEIIIDRNKKM